MIVGFWRRLPLPAPVPALAQFIRGRIRPGKPVEGTGVLKVEWTNPHAHLRRLRG
jgi:hypothetical protein